MSFTVGATTEKQLFPYGGKLVSKDAMEREIEKLRSDSKEFDNNYGRLDPRAIEKRGEYDKKLAEFNEIKKLLDTRTAFVNESVKRYDYVKSPRGFSLGSKCEKIYMDANNGKIPMSAYENTSIAPTCAEGETVASESVKDYLRIVNADDENNVIFFDNLKIGESVYSDDSDTIDSAFTDLHEIRLENAESAKACEIFMSSKEPIELDPVLLNNAINILSAKTRRSDSMMILTNKSGFAKLDLVDGVSGVSLIKKVNGEMIYRDKYIVQELPDEILRSDDNGDPCIMGALTDICKFFVIRDEGWSSEDWLECSVQNRRIRKEIVQLTTISDAGYVWGYLA